jgi:hypothetical protein
MTDHRRLGAELNNRVWDVLETGVVGPDSPADEREDLLYAAYASAHHWRQVGTPANRARASISCPEPPPKWASSRWRCVTPTAASSWWRRTRDAMEDWDLAFALEALARAQAGSGSTDRRTPRTPGR